MNGLIIRVGSLIDEAFFGIRHQQSFIGRWERVGKLDNRTCQVDWNFSSSAPEGNRNAVGEHALECYCRSLIN